MRALALTLPLLCGCVATSGELERAVGDITARVDEIAQEARADADAAREAWRRGDITYAELQRQLADIREATLDVSKETAREVIGDLRETIEARPEVVGGVAGDVSRDLIPGPWGDLIAMVLAGGGAYVASRRKAKEEAERINRERDMARVMRGERTDRPPTVGS